MCFNTRNSPQPTVQQRYQRVYKHRPPKRPPRPLGRLFHSVARPGAARPKTSISPGPEQSENHRQGGPQGVGKPVFLAVNIAPSPLHKQLLLAALALATAGNVGDQTALFSVGHLPPPADRPTRRQPPGQREIASAANCARRPASSPRRQPHLPHPPEPPPQREESPPVQAD